MEQSVHLREEVCENFTEKCFTLWAVPSSNTNHSEQSLKELAKHRLKTRFDVSNMKSFDEYSKIRSSCHIIEQVNEEFYCDCFLGHAVQDRVVGGYLGCQIQASWCQEKERSPKKAATMSGEES